MIEVRSFRNDDVPGLLAAYRKHWGVSGEPPAVNASILERVVLGRASFNPRDLLVAVTDGQMVGWCHLLRPSPQASQSAMPNHWTVLQICFAGHDGVHAGDELLKAAESTARQAGGTRLDVGLADSRISGYLGVSPHGGTLAIPVADSPTNSLLSRRGYQSGPEVLSVGTDPTSFRPPISRHSMQLRRTSRVQRHEMLPQNTEISGPLSNLDLYRYQLVEHRTERVITVLDVWQSDMEAAIMDGSRAILDTDPLPAIPVSEPVRPEGFRGGNCAPVNSAEPTTADASGQFLIGSAIAWLATESIFHVQGVTPAGDARWRDLYQPLGFELENRGRCWTRSFSDQ